MNKAPLRVGAEDCLQIHYSIRCDGTELESSDAQAPVSYQMGQGLWPVQLELAMMNEPLGAVLELRFGAAEAVFGKIDPERVMLLQSDDFEQTPQTGELIEFELPDGACVEGQVLCVREEEIEVDFNHPYAGRDLDIRIHIEHIEANTGE